jgi:hypothetical protein
VLRCGDFPTALDQAPPKMAPGALHSIGFIDGSLSTDWRRSDHCEDLSLQYVWHDYLWNELRGSLASRLPPKALMRACREIVLWDL